MVPNLFLSPYRKALPIILVGSFACVQASAVCPNDPDCSPTADTYLVREDCTGLANCFETLHELTGWWTSSFPPIEPDFVVGSGCGSTAVCVTGWLWGGDDSNPGRTPPSAESRVTIDIGPGTFQPFVCPSAETPNGYVTVRGAGREATTLGGEEFWGLFGDWGVVVAGCEELVFSDLRAWGPSVGVSWFNGGTAVWTGVDMFATGESGLLYAAGWVDQHYPSQFDPNDTNTRSIHTLYNVRASASLDATDPAKTILAGYDSRWAQTTFVGGSIGIGPASGIASISNLGLRAENESLFFATDVKIHVRLEGTTASGPLSGVVSGNSSRVFLQDSTVAVEGPGTNDDLVEGAGGRIVISDSILH